MARSTMEVAFLGTQKTEMEGAKYVKVFYGDEPDGKTEHGLSIIGMAIAEDAADFLAAKYPPGHTTLQIVPADKSANAFDNVFEARLRTLGFTVRSAAPTGPAGSAAPDALTLSYILDRIEADASYYLQIRLSDGTAISRAYTATGQPEAGRSSTPHEFKLPVLKRMELKARSAVDGLQ